MSCQIAHRYIGGSTYFNGASSCITIGDVHGFTSGNFGFSGWVKPASVAGTQALLGKRGVGETSYALYIRDNGRLDFFCNNVDYAQTTVPLIANAWTHFIVTYIDGSVKIRFNTEVKGSATSIPQPSVAVEDLMLGTDSEYKNVFLNGRLAEICLFTIQADFTDEDAQTLYTTGTLPSGAVAFYPLDDLPSSYRDTIGGATGTGTATTYSTDTPVQMKTAIDMEARSSLSFDGVDDVVTVAGLSNSLTGKTGFAMTVEANFPSTETYKGGFGFRPASANQDAFDSFYVLPEGGTSFQARFRNSAGTAYTKSLSLPLGYFKKITLNYTGAALEIWVAGQKIAQVAATGTFGANSIDFVLGRAGSYTTFGKLKTKKAYIHSVPLSSVEIIDLHFNNKVPYKGQPDILVLDLTMNEGAGATVYDQSGNGNHGTITGATWSAEVPNAPLVPIGGNLLKNGALGYLPPIDGVACTNTNRWLDGSAAGSAVYNPVGILTGGTASNFHYYKNGGPNNKPCLKITITAGQYGFLYLDKKNTSLRNPIHLNGFELRPSTSYVFSGWVKAENVTGDSDGAWIDIPKTKADGTSSSGGDADQLIPATRLKVNSDWAFHTRTFTTPADVASGTVRLNVYGHTGAGTLAGDFYFADISLLPTTPVVNIPLSAPAVAITCP